MIGDARRGDPARRFPFSAVIGQPEARLALLLAVIDPAIGGVLLRGDKGSARSTLARGLAGLLPGAARFVDISPGTSEDRVLGSLDTATGSDGETQFRAGLLAAAHGGVLHLAAVNRLPQHLVEVLLDVAASGVNRVERNGIWHEHPAHVVLVASMSPEEGELRPQILDRFGLSVDVVAPGDPAIRAEVVRRRLTHDSGGIVDGHDGDIVLRARLAAAMPADLPTSVVDFACALAAGLGAEGLRGDLVLCRAAAAFAGWEGRSITTEADVERVAPLALGHRCRRRPYDPPTLAPGELERALAAARKAFVVGAEGAAAGDGEEPTDAGDPTISGTATSGTATSDRAAQAPADEEAGREGEPVGDPIRPGQLDAAQPAADEEASREGDAGEPVGDPIPAGQVDAAQPAADEADGTDVDAEEVPPSAESTGEPAAQGN
jgi:magnesium chelatase subunit D